MEKIKNILIIIVIIGGFLSSCTKDEGPVIIENSTSQIDNVSYSLDIQPIFDDKCIACHDQNHSSGLDLKTSNSYGDLVNITSSAYSPILRIKPLSKDSSVLWHKIVNTGIYGGKMPQIGSALTNLEINKIEKWIELGAKND